MRSVLVAAALAACASAQGGMNIGGKMVVVRSQSENDAFNLALRDIERDLYSVTSLAPVFLNGPPGANSLPPGTTVLYFGTTQYAPWLNTMGLPAGCFSGWESHCVVSLQNGPGGYPSIVATGADKGALFGLYEFSSSILGFKPLFLFTDTPASYAGAAGIDVPANLSIIIPPPKYQYRAVFLNDEDLSAVSRQDPLGKNTLDLAAWDVFFQTALRLKCNLFLVGTNPFPDSTANALAARRGLIISHHHYDLVGSNVFNWPLSGNEWNWENNAGTMSYLWRASIAAQSDYDVIWSVGLRGLNDVEYPGCGTNNPAQQEICGRTVSEAMANQTAWIRSTPGQENSTQVLYMWHELLDLLVGGYLTIPEGVRTIFTDGGAGYVPLDGNWSSLAEGCYYHTAFYGGGGGAGNQLMEMIPGARIINQLLNVIDNSKDTFMFVLNPSDIRPNPMTTGLTYDFIYNPSKYNQTTDNYAAARMYYAQFGVDYNGLSAADSITYASIWEQYFNISFIFAANSGDLLLAYDVGNAAQSIANDWKAGKGVSQQTINNINFRISQINAQQALTQLQALNQTAYQLFANVPANRRGFYVSHTLLNLATNIASVQALVLMGSAAQALASQGGNAPNPASGTAIAQQALAAMDQLFAIRRVTEGDSSAWAGVVDPIVNMPQAQPMRAYYLADSLSDMQWPRGAIESLLVSLDQQTAGQPLLPVRQSVWYQFEAYQQENKQNYPLVSFNPNWNLPTWVRCNCRTSDVQGNTCGNGPDGGWFTQGSDTRVTMQILDSTTAQAPHNATRGAMLELAKHGYIPSSSRNLVNSIVNDPQATLNIYYTSDGSVPTTSSPQYTPGNAPRLTDLLQSGQTSVTVKAAGWVNGVALGQVTTTTWDART